MAYPNIQVETRAPAAKTLPRSYLAVWAALGGLAATYLALVAVREFDPPVLAQRINPAQQVKTAQLPDDSNLKLRMRDLQADVSSLRLELEANAKDAGTAVRLAALEERMSLETGQPVAKRPAAVPASADPAALPAARQDAAPAPAAAMVAAVQAPVAAAAAVSQPGATPPEASAPAAKPEVAAIAMVPQELIRPLETGSLAPLAKQTSPLPAPGNTVAATPAPVPAIAAAAPPEAAPISFGPAIVKSEPKPIGVQLSSGATVEAIQLTWSLLSDQYPDALRKLEPRYTTSGTPEAGQTFDLIAGPLRSAADARKVCKALAARGTDCRVAEFAGAAF